MEIMKLDETKVKLLHPDAKIPVYSTEFAAGCDIFTIDEVVIQPPEIIGLKRKDMFDPDSELIECAFWDRNCIKLVPKFNSAVLRTGIAIQLEPDEELQIRGRSGLGFESDVIPFYGTIDADYTGEIKVKLYNISMKPLKVEKGMKIAQGVLSKYLRKNFVIVDELEKTKRGDKGFGSTGLK